MSFISKGRVTGGFFFARLQRLSIWLRFFTLNFSLVINLFNFFPEFFNGLHTFLHVGGQWGLNQERFVCKCSMHTSHPPSGMVLEYGRIPCVYGYILIVFVANFNPF